MEGGGSENANAQNFDIFVIFMLKSWNLVYFNTFVIIGGRRGKNYWGEGEVPCPGPVKFN